MSATPEHGGLSEVEIERGARALAKHFADSDDALTLGAYADALEVALASMGLTPCASCGDPAITRIILRGVRTPACLRHYNVWQTPTARAAAPDALRERVEALAAEWDHNYHFAAARLRALLDDPAAAGRATKGGTS